MPNTFTVTSINNITKDNNDNIVVYMWSSTPNPNWQIGKIPTDEESETGDPRYIRTEFNVLLKRDNTGKKTINYSQ